VFKWIVYFLIIFLALPAFSIDTKYFTAFIYKQNSFLGSEFQISPEMRFDRGAKELYYYHFRTGFLFHPRNWLDLGFYYVFNNEKDSNGNWDPDAGFEFAIDPKIIINIVQKKEQQFEERVGEALEDEPDALKMINAGVVRAVDIISYGEIEFHDVDWRNLSTVNMVYQLKPKIEWQVDDSIYYVQDDIFYTLKYGEVYRNWATVGRIRPLNKALTLDLFYTFENEKPFYINPWEYAHVIGTRFILDRVSR